MKKLIASLPPFMRHAVVRFAGVGVLNTLLSVSIIFTLKWLGANDVLANMGGYIAGLTLSFILNKKWTFNSKQSTLPALLRFVAVFAVSYAINLAVVLSLISFGVNAYVSHLAGMPVYTVVFYIGCRYFAFAERRETQATR